MRPYNKIDGIQIELRDEKDDIEELTLLLNLAYKKLAEKGLKYVASRQDSTITKNRIENAACYIAKREGKMIGTISYYSPKNVSGCEWYDQSFVASYGQFAVHPEFQNIGIGDKLIQIAENLAKKDNAKEISIDTAETATDLINFYSKRGYRSVGNIKWKSVNYRSVLLSKAIE